MWSGNLKYPNACFPRWSPLGALTFSGCAWAGLTRLFLWTELHVQCLLPWRQESWGWLGREPCPNIPAVASFEADVLCLLLPLSCPRSACCCLTLGPVPAVIPFILPLEPRGQVCFKLLEKSVGLDLGHTRPQLDHLPTSEGKGEHLAAEAWKCLSCPERSLRLKEPLSQKVEKNAILLPWVWWGLPILHSPLQAISAQPPIDPAWERGTRRS